MKGSESRWRTCASPQRSASGSRHDFFAIHTQRQKKMGCLMVQSGKDRLDNWEKESKRRRKCRIISRSEQRIAHLSAVPGLDRNVD